MPAFPTMLVLVQIATLMSADALQAQASGPVPIVGGVEVPLGRWDEVAAFQIGVRFCSGVVVAPRLMLTAAHCLSEVDPARADDITVAFGPSIYAPAALTAATDIGVFEQYCPDCTRDRYDLGYLILRDAVRLPEGFPTLVTDQASWDAVMVEGQSLVVVGFGQDEDGNPTLSDAKGVGVKREVTVDYAPFSESGHDFRGGGNGRGTCAGDSGGPAFVQLPDGRWAVAGVLSGGFGACGDGGLFMVPLPALPWIRDRTGVDLLPPGCSDAECVDTSLSEEGCGCRLERKRQPRAFVVLLMVCVFMRLARSRAR